MLNTQHIFSEKIRIAISLTTAAALQISRKKPRDPECSITWASESVFLSVVPDIYVHKGPHGPAVDPSVCSCPGAEPWPECLIWSNWAAGESLKPHSCSDVISQLAVGSLPHHPQQHPLGSPFRQPC